MTPVYVFGFLMFSCLGQLLSAVYGEGNGYQGKCPPFFDCGFLKKIRFPFTKSEKPNCGLFAIQNCDDPWVFKEIQLQINGTWFPVINVGQPSPYIIQIRDPNLYNSLQSRNCNVLSNNYTLPFSSPFASFHIQYSVTMFRCNCTLNVKPPNPEIFNYQCAPYNIYHGNLINESRRSFEACSMVQLPAKDLPDAKDPFTFVTADISIEVSLSADCANCRKKKGNCQLDRKRKFYCVGGNKRSDLKLKLGLAIGLPIILVIGLLLLALYKRKYAPSDTQFQSRHTNADPYSNIDPESCGVYSGVPLFSYKELEEATNNFDSSRKLGGGGFGTVYYGELLDGREVAIKRLYDHNNRRVEQFINEIEILTRLRHKNLVVLHGCTSHHSHELLLVYEYIPKGTVASHLHGDLRQRGFLPWPIRMKIAIETASALAYLHASNTIHRDVKTNNILLDNDFCVKVADFGLSRLFPTNVTHVFTAPQGTPGYVDPEYNKCYQLTNKSDVYSFGVVLIELISSMQAVDMTRHKEEINLADLAIKKIQKGELNELVDPSLGFESDNEVKKMIVAVVELAFRCLQQDRELRPAMDEVLEMLKRIASGEDELEHPEEAYAHDVGISNSSLQMQSQRPAPLDSDEVGSLKNMKKSPNNVTDKWESESTTPNISS
ncbi:hypothetical protein L6164_026835 [Bauhinia variegata]|uniref:Uncharacterized protein n=1 Tax=Bauhinia variegata TaxID=167791 RepID=A0ACB9LRQ6_BAUVA|nr:hypothetical protein L6164_026835 [Bauhinia variegata]